MRNVRLVQSGLGGAVITAGAALIVIIFVSGLGGVRLPLLVMLAFVLAAALVGGLIQWSVVASGGKVADAILSPKGNTTPYTPTFSHIEALEIRGDLDGAERAWEEACAEYPENALVWVKAAEFHLRLRHAPSAAVERYRRARELAGAPSELVRYASQKLVDLYLGPLADEGRALGELRRLIDRFPGTRAAEDARAALARLKAERRTD